MKTVVIVATFLTLSGAAEANALRRQEYAGRERQALIACTVLGCIPVPPGCGRTAGRTRSGSPSGFDVIVCPPGVRPLR
jgi:hypothetical protein